MTTPGEQMAERIALALSKGWGFKDLKLSATPTGRHSLWASPPLSPGWQCHKVDGDVPRHLALDRLLDEAGVEKATFPLTLGP